MRSLFVAFLSGLSVLFIACEKDNATSTSATSPEAEYIETAEQQLAEIERLVFQDNFAGERKVVDLPAGSINGLQAAIDEAGPNGIVNVKSGLHVEETTVNVNFTVRIIGEEGAVIESKYPGMLEYPIEVNPAIRIENGNFVHVSNIQFVPGTESGVGNVGILVYNADYAYIKDNDFQGYQMAVIVDDSDFAFIQDNTAEGPFSEGYVFPLSIGITNLGDAHARTKNNSVTDFATGYFASGNNGIFSGNTAEGGQTGFFFCTGGGLVLPDGTPISASEAANDWVSIFNLAKNTGIGHLIIDGVNNCKIISNSAENCSVYDVEFVGPTLRFGTPEPLPTTFENLFIDGASTDIEVKDCGVDNVIIGGQLVDLAEDPCI